MLIEIYWMGGALQYLSINWKQARLIYSWDLSYLWLTRVCVCVCVSETRAHGAGGPSDHRHAVHPGARQESEGGSTRMLPPVLRQNQGVCVCVCVWRDPSAVCVKSSHLYLYSPSNNTDCVKATAQYQNRNIISKLK